MAIATAPFKPFTLNLRGRPVKIVRPQVMGIINVTPDSFYAGSRAATHEQVARCVNEMIAAGADMIDIGAYSSRPGADDVTPAEETARLRMGMQALRSVAPEVTVSVDTFRAAVARAAVEEMGVDMVNDISAGLLDPSMIATVASLRVPYIAMHMRGTPATMQQFTDYPRGVVAGVIDELSRRIDIARQAGIADVIADPGCGFSKSVEQNYQLLGSVAVMQEALHAPMLVGISRKSMLTRPLGITPAEAIFATTAANAIALTGGAAIIRVHDVAAAVHARSVVDLTLSSLSLDPQS